MVAGPSEPGGIGRIWTKVELDRLYDANALDALEAFILDDLAELREHPSRRRRDEPSIIAHRDRMIRAAHDAGMSIDQLATLASLSPRQVFRILARPVDAN